VKKISYTRKKKRNSSTQQIDVTDSVSVLDCIDGGRVDEEEDTFFLTTIYCRSERNAHIYICSHVCRSLSFENERENERIRE